MGPMRFIIVITLLAVPGPSRQEADVDSNPVEFTAESNGGGPALYARFCMGCHGENGDGRGALADFLLPRPRNFKSGQFKGRSSPPDHAPMRYDVQRSITHGSPVSAMLSYSFLDPGSTAALIEHVRDLSASRLRIGGVEHDLQPLATFGKPYRSGNFVRALGGPLPSLESQARAHLMYRSAGCVQCHGEKGDGRGPAAAALPPTSEGSPNFAADFTQGVYSGGPNARHLYLRISAGVPGAAMPAHPGLSVADRWALSHYVLGFSRQTETLPLPHSEKVVARKVEGRGAPVDPADALWDEMPALKKPPEELFNGAPMHPELVMPLYFQPLRRAPDSAAYFPASLRAVHDGRTLSVLVEWEDGAAQAGDRLEMQFAIDPRFALRGSADFPVQLWRWSAAAPADVVVGDAFGPFDLRPRRPAPVDVKALARRVGNRWRVLFRKVIGPPDPDFSIGSEMWVSFGMRDGDRALIEDPPEPRFEADEEEDIKAEKLRHHRRELRERADLRERFAAMPAAITTWHRFAVVNESLRPR